MSDTSGRNVFDCSCKPAGPKFRWWLVPAAIAVTLIGFAIYYPHSRGGKQQAGWERARPVIPKLVGAIPKDGRFRDVIVDECTSNNGLAVSGTVACQEDLDELKSRLNPIAGAVPLAWYVEVDLLSEGAGTTRPGSGGGAGTTRSIR